MNNNNTAHNSITSSVVNLQKKLNDVISPSSSKPDEDDDYGNDIDDDQLHAEEVSSSINSHNSIPMAHREYEKTLRQLEAECRTHIKCE